MAHSANHSKIIIGQIGAPFGIKGWVKIHSFTNPIENILDYDPWCISAAEGWQLITPEQGALHSNQIIAKFPACNDRNQAQLYTHKEIAIERHQLKKAGPNEYYWIELEGLTVVNTAGERLGTVSRLMATGANDILVVTQANHQILIPYIKQVIHSVDLETKQIVVDWQADW